MAARSLPNTITLARLAAVPIIIWLTYGPTPVRIAIAAALFALAVASDWLDGYLARRLQMRSAFGALMDPLVDKVLVLCLLFVFADRGLVPTWLALLSMVREFAATAVRHGASSQTEVVGANWMGKTKFCMQAAFVGLAYIHLLMTSAGRPLPGARAFLFWCLLVITVISYVFLARFALRHRAVLTGSQAAPGERSGP